MSSLRPQHRRGNGAVGVTLMRSANQFNNARRLGTNAQGKDGTWKPRGKPNDAKRMRLPRVERRRMHAPHTGGQRARLTREQAQQQEHRARAACAAQAPLAPPRPLTSPATPNETPRNGKIRALCMIRGGLFSEKTPFVARSSRGVFPKGDLQGISDTWRANLAKVSSFWMHGSDMLPGRGAFPVRGTFWDT